MSENCFCYKERPTLEKTLEQTLEQTLDKMVRKGALDAYIRDNSKRSLDGLLSLREARTINGWVEVNGNRKIVSFPSSKYDIGIAPANSYVWRCHYGAIAVEERE